MGITVDKFLSSVDAIQATNPEYKLGRSGDDGYCDCIGLIIGAIRRSGGTWNGIHGSNYAARHEVDKLSPIDLHTLVRGMAVFKATEDTTNLPSRYQNGGSYYNGDLHDYYHVGVVYSVSPLIIKHCTTGSRYKNGKRVDILEDTKLGKWSHCGKLLAVNYEQKEEDPTVENTYIVTAEGGVNFRLKPAKNATKICSIPKNSIVTGSEYNDTWLKITYNGKTGYAMSEFLCEWEDATDLDDTTDVVDSSDLGARISALEKRIAAVEKLVGSAGVG